VAYIVQGKCKHFEGSWQAKLQKVMLKANMDEKIKAMGSAAENVSSAGRLGVFI